MSTVIIDYGAGNLHSIAKAVEYAAGTGKTKIAITDDPKEIEKADRVILPGVGAFGACADALRSHGGIIDALNEAVIEQQKPFLGICVGMQLLAEEGLEHGTHAGLGWVKGKVVKIEPENLSDKIPHMGWNELNLTANHEFFRDINSGDHAYFVHSYHMLCDDAQDIIATVNYGGVEITAAVAKDNIVATQFHPEKSQEVGLKILKNFIKL